MDTTKLPLLIDTRELTRSARTMEGVFDVDRLPRLATLLTRADSSLAWQVAGESRRRADGGDEELLHLRLHGEVAMQCVRCLGDASVSLDVDRSFRLVGSEEEAAREDADDAEYDVLAGGRRFDLGELIEDEAIMALPAIARHEDCTLPAGAADEPGAASADGPDGESGDRIRPFAGLAALTKREH